MFIRRARACVCDSRYVEDEPLTKKLYITDIQATDEGSYRCSATRADFSEQKQVTLKLYSNYPRYLIHRSFNPL